MLKWCDNKDIPLVFLGHSFGTSVASIFSNYLHNNSSELSIPLVGVELFISISGISFSFLQQMELYQQSSEELEQMLSTSHPDSSKRLTSLIQENSLRMFDAVPDYLADVNSPAYQSTLQGELQIVHQMSLGSNLFYDCFNRH